MAIYAIYKITNLVNQKVYIGQTQRRPSSRFVNHCSAARNGSPHALHSAMRKYGENNFSFEVIDTSANNAKDLNLLEVQYVTQFKSYAGAPGSNGYNMTVGGMGRYGSKSLLDMGKERSPHFECPYCSKVGKSENFVIKHFDNCKYQPLIGPEIPRDILKERRLSVKSNKSNSSSCAPKGSKWFNDGNKNYRLTQEEGDSNKLKLGRLMFWTEAAKLEKSKSMTGDKNHRNGKIHTQEAKDKCGAANRGRKDTAETRKAKSEGHKDKAIYTWHHVVHGIVQCTRDELIKNWNISSSGVDHILCKNGRPCKGWNVVQ